MTNKLSPFYVYTIGYVDELNRVYKTSRRGNFAENNRWVKVAQLLDEAQAIRQRMPLVFADASTIEGLTPIRLPVSKSTLIEMNGDQPLSDDYIRPYVLCHTPDLLGAALKPEPPKARPSKWLNKVIPSQNQARKPRSGA